MQNLQIMGIKERETLQAEVTENILNKIYGGRCPSKYKRQTVPGNNPHVVFKLKH